MNSTALMANERTVTGMADRIEIIPKRLIYICNPSPIKFFFFGCPEGLLICNFRFHIWPGKPRTHILIRTPLLCIERHNNATIIGNKYQLHIFRKRR